MLSARVLGSALLQPAARGAAALSPHAGPAAAPPPRRCPLEAGCTVPNSTVTFPYQGCQLIDLSEFLAVSVNTGELKVEGNDVPITAGACSGAQRPPRCRCNREQPPAPSPPVPLQLGCWRGLPAPAPAAASRLLCAACAAAAAGSPLFFSVPKLSGYDVEVGRNFGGKFNYTCANSVTAGSCVLLGTAEVRWKSPWRCRWRRPCLRASLLPHRLASTAAAARVPPCRRPAPRPCLPKTS